MKKIIMAAAALTAGIVMAADDSIVSSTVVGYQTVEAPQGKFLIMGSAFYSTTPTKDESSESFGKAINDIIGSVEGVDWDEDGVFLDTATQIQVPSPEGGYKTYYYLNNGYVSETEEKAGWCDAYGNLVEDELTPMVAFWFRSVPGKSTAKSNGALSTNSQERILCVSGFALRGNAYPTSIKLNTNNMTVEGIKGVDWDGEGDFLNTASQIQVPSSNGGYKTYYYLNNGYVSETEEKAGWCDAYGNLVDDEIPLSQGFWTKGTSGEFTLVFNSSLTK